MFGSEIHKSNCNVRNLNQGRCKDSRARGADRGSKGTDYHGPVSLSQKWRAPEVLFVNAMGYASHIHINDCLFQSNSACFLLI